MTGGSSGIGAATAHRLAEAGAFVVVGYHAGRERAEAVVSGLPGHGHTTLPMPMHDSAALLEAAKAVKRGFGRVDVLVNSAGTTKSIPHHDLDGLTDEIFDEIYAVNVRGPFATVRAFRALLEHSQDAVVVNISSISASTGSGSSVAYCASKAALDTMGRSLARALAPTIRFVSVSPAAVDTGFVPGRAARALLAHAESAPLKVVADPDDVAVAVLGAVTHLRLATGTEIVVDAGKHL
ncbi:SDR family oxidoreductase [Streptomyces sp. NBC_01356]|uniref:SDR family NAD(P)-dependent oxidoreductase n=1 Tax=Streptomyces sp. NBC_01356 TaxID=2903836 RepID=UPI002E348EF0|nr:SDR family oxidoreductase [Streptomyces sp. NBC_01356]